ncbi:TPA: hypothetical protein RTH17_001704 [Campylobacter jejuni]|nr:hypothetical protein [Campylobacter jejuni]HDZ4984501.1 hypothetical protein [Campylobacter jejuni]HDZ5081300.1 hypothetical protein [Campylobacter jejuni]
MQTITIKAKEQEINKLLDILKELDISYELESNNYENGRAKLCIFKEVKNITDKIINRA